MVCETPNECNDVNWPTNLCPACVESIENAAIQSALNMGIPDEFGCGECGLWFLKDDFFLHSCITKLMEAHIRHRLVFGDED